MTSHAEAAKMSESEGKAPETEVEESPEVEAPETETGQPEDAEVEAGAEEAEVEPSAPEAAEEAVEEGAEAAPEESEPAPEAKPFTLRLDGQRYDVAGAFETQTPDAQGNPTDVIVIPKQAWQREVLPRIADRATWARKEADYRRQIAEVQPDRHPDSIRGRVLAEELEKALASEESFAAWVANFETNKELLKLRIENAVASTGLEVRDERDKSRESEEAWHRTSQQIASDIPQVVQVGAKQLADSEGLSVTDDAIRLATEEIHDNWTLYYFPADEDTARIAGVEPGTYVRDDDRVLRTIQRFATLARNGSLASERAEATEKANEAALSGGKEKPQAVAAKGSSAAATKEKAFESREDFLRWGGVDI